MPAPKKANPYKSGDDFRAALKEAGTVVLLAEAAGVSENTLRKWMRDLGVKVEPVARTASPGGEALARADAAELEAMVAAVGPRVLGRVLDVSADTVRKACERKGVSASPKQSPRLQMYARRVRELEKREESLAELRAEIANAAKVAGAAAPPKAPTYARPRKDRRGALELVAHVSDLQYGEHVGHETPGADYSPEVFEEERLPRYLDAVEALIENTVALGPLRRVWIAQGGDFVEGHEVFHGSSAWHLADGYDAGTQVVRLSQVWANAVARIASHAKAAGAEVWVTSVVGNHGVHGGKKGGGSAAPATLNYDFLTYEMVRAHLAGMPDHAGVDFYDREARKAVYFETVGGLVAMTHGQEDRGGGIVGVPITTGYRNSMSARLALSTGSQPVDPILELKGHYHRPMTLTIAADRITAWNGAWIGANNLSIGRGGASSPSQNVHVLHAEHGVIATHRVRLSGRIEAPVEIIGGSAA
jgi:transposase-like protein